MIEEAAAAYRDAQAAKKAADACKKVKQAADRAKEIKKVRDAENAIDKAKDIQKAQSKNPAKIDRITKTENTNLKKELRDIANDHNNP